MQSAETFRNSVSAAGTSTRFKTARVDGKTMPAWISSDSNNFSYSWTIDRGESATIISTPVPLGLGPMMLYATCAFSTSKGMDFFSFHRMNVRCSSGFLDGFSAVRKEIRAISSGTTTAISEPLKPDRLTSSRRRGLVAAIFSPRGIGDATRPSILVRRALTPAMMICSDVNSHAQSGACGLKSCATVSASPLSNESNLINLFESGYARENFRESGFTQERHTFFMRSPLNVGSGLSFDDHFADMIGQIQQFV